MSGMGLELAGAIIGLTLLGLWIDHKFDTGPYGIVICASLGVIGGMYNLIRQALKQTSRSADPPDGEENGQ